MLPKEVLHTDLYDIVLNVEDDIRKFSEISNVDYVVAVSTTGTFPASLISKRINKPMFCINYSEELLLNFLLSDKNLNSVLLVDLICSDERLQEISSFIVKNKPTCKVISYATFVSSISVNKKPDYYHLCSDKYYLTTWNQNSITPETHLERLLHDDIYNHSKTSKLFCFSSKECYLNFINKYGDAISSNELLILDDEHNFSTERTEQTLKDTLNSSEMKLRIYFKNIFDVIKQNGVTDYFSNSIKEALIVSNELSNLNVFYVERDFSYKIRSNKIKA